MVKQLEYKKGSKARLWIDELPDSSINGSQFIENKAHTHCDKKWTATNIGIELYLQKHNSNYGLLGLEICPANESDIFHTKVYYDDMDSTLFDDTLAYNKKTVFSGLTKEYAEAVSKKIQEFIEQNPNMPSGTLIIKTASHCEVGSSKALFSILTELLLNILQLNKSDLHDEEIQELLDKLLIFR